MNITDEQVRAIQSVLDSVRGNPAPAPNPAPTPTPEPAPAPAPAPAPSGVARVNRGDVMRGVNLPAGRVMFVFNTGSEGRLSVSEYGASQSWRHVQVVEVQGGQVLYDQSGRAHSFDWISGQPKWPGGPVVQANADYYVYVDSDVGGPAAIEFH